MALMPAILTSSPNVSFGRRSSSAAWQADVDLGPEERALGGREVARSILRLYLVATFGERLALRPDAENHPAEDQDRDRLHGYRPDVLCHQEGNADEDEDDNDGDVLGGFEGQSEQHGDTVR